jgi:hypothetical protein
MNTAIHTNVKVSAKADAKMMVSAKANVNINRVI